MTGYTVRGQWPEYVVSSDNGGEIHHAPGMAAVMKWLSWVLEPGDTITWQATVIPGTPK